MSSDGPGGKSRTFYHLSTIFVRSSVHNMHTNNLFYRLHNSLQDQVPLMSCWGRGGGNQSKDLAN